MSSPLFNLLHISKPCSLYLFIDFNFASIPISGYEYFFNYEMNTKTWRNFVNKQILQTYHRLLIEKQLKECKKIEKELKDSIEDTDRKIRDVEIAK